MIMFYGEVTSGFHNCIIFWLILSIENSEFFEIFPTIATYLFDEKLAKKYSLHF